MTTTRPWMMAAVLLFGLQLSSTALDAPWRLIYESNGQFFSGVARVHLGEGLRLTKGQDFIYNQDNPYQWAGRDPMEPRAYAHHPPGLGLSLALAFALIEPARGVARLATIAMHLAGLLVLMLIVQRWAEPRLPYAALFTGIFGAAAPIAAFFGRNVCHEAWVGLWMLLATATYLIRVEQGRPGTKKEDAAVCALIAIATFYDWPGLYVVPVLMIVEAFHGRAFKRFNILLAASSTIVLVLLVAQIFWAAPRQGLPLLYEGARARVDPATYHLTWESWWPRVWSFLLSNYTRVAMLAATMTVVAWILRWLLRRDPMRPMSLFVAIWIAVGAIHIFAFPSGSWMHPYWFWYLLPAVSASAGMFLSALWGPWLGWLRGALRVLVIVILASFACESRETLIGWHEVAKAPTGNILLDHPLPAPLAHLCDLCSLAPPQRRTVVANLR